MLRELFEAALSKADASVRRLGYVHESVAIAARHRRNTEAWAPHLERTRRFVAQAATGGESIAVLGSGSLLDVAHDSVFSVVTDKAQLSCSSSLNASLKPILFRNSTKISKVAAEISVPSFCAA